MKDIMGKMIERGVVMKRLIDCVMSQKGASIQLGVSERHIRRMLKRYKSDGPNSLVHGNTGKPNNRKIDSEIEAKAIAWLAQNGQDFGSQFAQEKLKEYVGIETSPSTVRNWRIKHGFLKPKTFREKKQFQRRQRKEYFGAMVQIDGSPHDWFEGRRGKCTLLTIIDDATGKIVSRFAEQETTIGLMHLMLLYIGQYGIPDAAYTDNGSPYSVNIGNQDGSKRTELHRAFEQVGMHLIHAKSPQAKGRVERNHAIHQDRLVKEMRLREISSIEEANRYLENEYIAAFNAQFAVPAVKIEDVHRSADRYPLSKIFSKQIQRQVQNDGVVQHEKRYYQITKGRIYAQPKSYITLCEHIDQTVTLWARDVKLEYELLSKKPMIHKKSATHSPGLRSPVSQNSKNWASGKYTPHRLKQDQSRVKPASPAEKKISVQKVIILNL